MAGAYSVILFRHSIIPSSSVSVHYLSNGCTYSNQIWHMDMSWENTGQVRIWSWFDDFLQSYAPFTLKIIWNFQFHSLSAQGQHIQLKFDIWICQQKIQVKFEFGHGSMIFGRLCPFYFENNLKFSVSVHYLPNGTTHSTQIWHMDMSSENTGQVQIWSWFDDFWQIMPLLLWK
jgi:hypothetical protein